MDVADHIADLKRDGTLLADVADQAGLDAAVPTCPQWVVETSCFISVASTGGPPPSWPGP